MAGPGAYMPDPRYAAGVQYWIVNGSLTTDRHPEGELLPRAQREQIDALLQARHNVQANLAELLAHHRVFMLKEPAGWRVHLQPNAYGAKTIALSLDLDNDRIRPRDDEWGESDDSMMDFAIHVDEPAARLGRDDGDPA